MLLHHCHIVSPATVCVETNTSREFCQRTMLSDPLYEIGNPPTGMQSPVSFRPAMSQCHNSNGSSSSLLHSERTLERNIPGSGVRWPRLRWRTSAPERLLLCQRFTAWAQVKAPLTKMSYKSTVEVGKLGERFLWHCSSNVYELFSAERVPELVAKHTINKQNKTK